MKSTTYCAISRMVPNATIEGVRNHVGNYGTLKRFTELGVEVGA